MDDPVEPSALEKRLAKYTHWISHLFGRNTGRVVTFWLDNKLFVGFQCDLCGEINHAQRSIRSVERVAESANG